MRVVAFGRLAARLRRFTRRRLRNRERLRRGPRVHIRGRLIQYVGCRRDCGDQYQQQPEAFSHSVLPREAFFPTERCKWWAWGVTACFAGVGAKRCKYWRQPYGRGPRLCRSGARGTAARVAAQRTVMPGTAPLDPW